MKATDEMLSAACQKSPNLIREHVREIVQAALDANTFLSNSKQENLKSPKHQYTIPSGEWVLPAIVKTMFGFSNNQLQKYRSTGLMLEGVHFLKNPANRIVYSPKAINAWMGGKL